MSSQKIKSNEITTDDLAFSAFLKMHGFTLLKLNQNRAKSTFVFDLGDKDPDHVKVEFVNSECLEFYNELRNLKKLI